MRKTISLVLVAAMLLTMLMVMPTSAATLDASNVQVDAQYFGGTLIFNEIFGTNSSGFHWGDEDPGDIYEYFTVKEGDASKGTLTIDGIIEEGEWTDKVYHIDSDYAPNNNGLTWNNNALFETPSAENTFFYWLQDATGGSLAPAEGLEYDVRLMWDEDYFYMAVSYLDTDGNVNEGTSEAGDNWNGDAIQFRLDPAGPNAVTGGTGYDASVDSFPYDPDIHGETDISLNCTYPWSNSETTWSTFGEETHSTIGNFVFSYYQSGYTDMCDSSKRYFPEDVTTDVENDDGTTSTKTETVYKTANIAYWGDLALDEPEKTAYACAYPRDINPHPALVQDQVDYEIAVPWTLVADDYAPVAGAELGFSMVRLNAELGEGPYNSYLTWGTGITGFETQYMPQTVGGSNCLVLTDESYDVAVNCEHTFAAATCETPEACTACGYERGFVSGHKYTFSNQSIPTGSSDGSITATCTVCNDTYTQILDATESSVKYDFLQTDTTIADQGWRAEGGFCIQWEDLDPDGSRYTAETDPTGTLAVKWWNEDGTAKNAFDNKTFGYAVADLTSDGQTGTYFDADNYETSYTETMDVYFSKLPLTSSIEGDNVYNTYFGQWFGGENGVKYLAGLVNVEDQWFFAIYPSSHQNPKTLEEFYDCALSYTPATEDQMNINTWHNYVFIFDNDAETAMLIWDDQLVAAATDYHFPTSDSDMQAIFIKHNAEAYVKNVEVGSTGLAAQRTTWRGEGGDTTSTYTVTINGVATEYEAGATVEISDAAYIDDGGIYYRFDKWVGDVDVLEDVTAATASFTMPEKDIVLDGSHFLIGDISKDGKVNAMDGNTVKRLIVGRIAIDADTTRAGDIDANGKVQSQDSNYLARMNTGSYSPEK